MRGADKRVGARGDTYRGQGGEEAACGGQYRTFAFAPHERSDPRRAPSGDPVQRVLHELTQSEVAVFYGD
jgi:hypothetical protein